jgi:hypothetical protein
MARKVDTITNAERGITDSMARKSLLADSVPHTPAGILETARTGATACTMAPVLTGGTGRLSVRSRFGTSGPICQDVLHHLRRPFAAGPVPVTFGVQPRSDSRHRQALALRRPLAELLHSVDDGLLPSVVAVGLAAFDALAAGAFALTGGPQLEDDDVLLELSDGAEHLPDQNAGRLVVGAGQVDAVSSENASADLRKLVEDYLLHHQVAGQAVGALDDDGADAVRFEAIHKRSQPRTIGKLSCAGYAEVGVFLDERQPGALGVTGNSEALSLRPVAVGLPFSTNPQITNGFRRHDKLF